MVHQPEVLVCWHNPASIHIVLGRRPWWFDCQRHHYDRQIGRMSVKRWRKVSLQLPLATDRRLYLFPAKGSFFSPEQNYLQSCTDLLNLYQCIHNNPIGSGSFTFRIGVMSTWRILERGLDYSWQRGIHWLTGCSVGEEELLRAYADFRGLRWRPVLSRSGWMAAKVTVCYSNFFFAKTIAQGMGGI